MFSCMEVGDLYRAFSGLGRGGSGRDKDVEVSSRSSRDGEDDEEALQWAAIERVPKDNERVEIELPIIEVRFENLNVEAVAYIESRAMPTVFNFFPSVVEESFNFLGIRPKRKKQIKILNDVSGFIKPGRMTLLLGPPSCGKTTLLLALAGKLDPKLKVSGKVTYNGYEFGPERIAAYIGQHDLHLEQMTVRETMEFAARCQGTGHRYKVLTELVKRKKQLNIEPDPEIVEFLEEATATEGKEASVIINYFLKILGLEDSADILVGNISGEQKKRLTIGEMLVGPSKVLCMDEIFTGLDSSTTFQIVKLIKQDIRIFNGTAVISLLQPAPEIYKLFDDIILLSDGLIVYQGPRGDVLGFFEHMGFKCPKRKGIVDFLQEVISRKDQEQYWASQEQPYSFVTAKQFADAFQSFPLGRQIEDQLSTPFDEANSHPAALATEKFGTGKWELLKACFSRELLLLKRNSFVYTSKLTLIAIVAIIAMTLFLRTEMHKTAVTEGGIFAGALFYSTNFITLIGMTEIFPTIAKLPVFYKHRDLLFFPTWAYSVPQMILKVPITLVEVALWVIMTYYVIGYDPNAGRFFKQYLVLAFVSQMASGLFQFIAATGRTMIVANTFGSLALTLLSARGGFVLSQDNIKKWWIWDYWISPLMYGQDAVAVNEFTASSWNHINPNSTLPLGVQVLKSRGLSTDPNWYWIGVGALVGFVLLFNFCYTLALAFLNPFQKPQANISEDSESKELHFSSRYSQSFLTQCMACLWKQSRSYRRNPQYTVVGLLFPISIALLFGTMFWNLGSKAVKREDLFNVIYSMYASVFSLGIQKASSVQPIVADVRTALFRGKAAGMNSTLPYAFAQALIELGYVLFQSMLYCIIVYSMMGFEWNAAKFFWYFLFMYITLLYFTFYGMMVAAVIPNQHIASVVSSIFYSLWNLFSGFIIPRPRMPVWWRWYSWLCPVSWTLYGMVVSQFGDVLDTGETVQSFLWSYFGFMHDFIGVAAAVVLAFAALFAFTFAISIRFFNYQGR